MYSKANKYHRPVQPTASASPTEAIGAQVHVCSSSPKTKKHDKKPGPDVDQATNILNEQANEPGTINKFYSSMRMVVSQNPINSVRLSSENCAFEKGCLKMC